MTLEQRLEALGFDKNEAKVYVSALQLGETTVGDLVRQSGLHKQLVYNAAEKLQEEGLLNIAQVRGRRHFMAADPSLLEQRIEERLGVVRGLLPALYSVANVKRKRDVVRTFQGQVAVQQHYQQSMRTQPEGKPLFITGVGGQHFFEIWKEESSQYVQLEQARIERNILLKLLFFVENQKAIADLPGITERKLIAVRTFQDGNQSPIDFAVWHTHVTLVLYGKEPHAIDIVGEHIVTAFRTYFELMWKQSNSLR